MTSHQPFRVKIYDDTGKQLQSLEDVRSDKLLKKTQDYFREKFK